jgi:hypothetical protein
MPRKRYASDDPEYRREKAKKKGGRKSPAPPAPRTRRKQSSPPSAKAAPSLPSPPIDFGAFTARRGESKKLSKVPTLAELATVEATELALVTGGECAKCHKPHGDDDRHCQHCGAALRRVCKCGRPLRDEQRFCPACGDAAPVIEAASTAAGTAGATAAGSVGLPSPLPLAPEWETDDLWFVAATVDIALVKLDGEALEEAPRNRINKRAAAVANKHFRVGGRWKEEIQLGMAIAGAIFPAAYLYWVVTPRERREAAEARRKIQSVPSEATP